MASNIPIKEIQISVPWGHIAGKTWGNEMDFPVVALHGILDNCGSFDKLIPLLPRSFYFICLDLPGHGMSSHFPDGIPLDFLNYVLGVRMVIDHFKLEKLYIMGHSLGAQIILFYSALYPEKIVKIICLDGIIPEPIPVEKTVARLRLRMDNIYDGIPGKTPPSYTYEEAMNRILNNRHSQLTEEAAHTMIKRSLTKSATGYKFSSDQRLKGFWRIPLSIEQIQNFVTSLQCPVLLVLSRETYRLYEPIYGENFVERLMALLYGTITMRTVTVEGNHDVHLNDAEKVAPHVSSFLLELKRNLWGREEDIPVVMLHGLLDNCCSFQRLIPLLKLKGFCFIAIDLPGHGKSSCMTTSLPIYLIDYAFCIDVVVNSLNLKDFYLIGHSMGSQISMLYTVIYPEKVKKLILLDGVLYKSFSEEKYFLELRRRFDQIKNIMKTSVSKGKTYTIEEIVDNLIMKRPTTISNENARLLVERSTIHSSDGYRLRIDPRLKLSLSPLLSLEQLFEVYKKIRCPILLIFTEDTIKKNSAKGSEFFYEFLDNCYNIRRIIVKGDHDVHLEHPERISDLISAFLDPTKSQI